jgi:hypothetical protein
MQLGGAQLVITLTCGLKNAASGRQPSRSRATSFAGEVGGFHFPSALREIHGFTYFGFYLNATS